ncbi:MAG: GNAT family N-acetyltransferase [Cyclobacteriaceae bacterium]
MKYAIRLFGESDFEDLHRAFVDAFSSNAVRFQPKPEDFKKRIFNKLNISLESSVIAVNEHNDIIGFSLFTIGYYEGVKAAYSGGVGVIHGYQGKGLAARMFEYSLPLLQEQKVNKIMLEVVTTNQRAVRLYERLGFTYKNRLKSFKSKNQVKAISGEVKIRKAENWQAEYEKFWTFAPAFLDSSGHLTHNLPNETILEATISGRLCGYVIFQPGLGRISQIAVAETYRNKGVGTALISKSQELSINKEITIMNLPEDAEASILALQKMGFRNEVDQFEMELII